MWIPLVELVVFIAFDVERCDAFSTSDAVFDNESDCRWIFYDLWQYDEATKKIRKASSPFPSPPPHSAKALSALTVLFGIKTRNRRTSNLPFFSASCSNALLASLRRPSVLVPIYLFFLALFQFLFWFLPLVRILPHGFRFLLLRHRTSSYAFTHSSISQTTRVLVFAQHHFFLLCGLKFWFFDFLLISFPSLIRTYSQPD